MTEQNLHWLSATEMAASVASNSLSPNEIAEAMIQRVDAVNPSINAIVQFDREQVTRDAAELSRQQEAGEKLGPLHGVVAHSLGSLATLHAAARGLPVQRLALIAPSSPPRRGRSGASGC